MSKHAVIVHVHPEPQSFNAALRDVATFELRRQGYTVEVSDLYARGFQPAEGPEHYAKRVDAECFSVLSEQRHASRTGALPTDVRYEIDRLEHADLLLLQFPLWWHGPPAMLKGWFDRVFVNGGLYTSTMRYDRGYFRGRRAICSLTSGAPAETFGSGGRAGDLEAMLWPIHYSLYYMGFSVLPAFLASGIQGDGYAYHKDNEAFAKKLEKYKSEWADRLANLDGTDAIAFPGWNDWDEFGRPKRACVRNQRPETHNDE